MLRRMTLLCVFLVLTACGLAPSAAEPVPTSDPSLLLSQRVPNPRAFGDPKAPIVMREFSDYQ